MTQHKLLALILASGLALTACKGEAKNEATATAEAASSEQTQPAQTAENIAYAMGMDIGRSFKEMKDMGTEVDLKAFQKGVEDMVNAKKTRFTEQQAQQIMMTFLTEQQQKHQAKKAEDIKANLEKGEQFLAENAKKEGVKTTASGLQYIIKKEGSGAKPKPTDVVTVTYEGRLIDNTVFDSSNLHGGEPVSFPLNQVIPGWTEGLQLIKEGGEITLFIPSKLAYGEQGSGKIAPNSALVFDVKLMKIGEAKQ